LLAPGGFAVVTKKGFRIGGRLYWSDELADHQGERLEYRLMRDAGQIAVFTTGDAQSFLCIALDVEALGLDLQTIALAARARQKKALSEKRADLRRLKREYRPDLLAKQIIEGAVPRRPFEIQATSNITALPYQNAAVAAAAEAVAALDSQPASRRRIERESSRDMSEENWERYRRLRKLKEIYGVDAPGGLDENDRIFLKIYEETPAYRTRVRMGAVG
jgi:hypothetical protein